MHGLHIISNNDAEYPCSMFNLSLSESCGVLDADGVKSAIAEAVIRLLYDKWSASGITTAKLIGLGVYEAMSRAARNGHKRRDYLSIRISGGSASGLRIVQVPSGDVCVLNFKRINLGWI